jgi:NAD-dependent SIR2 family protein deacetylase
MEFLHLHIAIEKEFIMKLDDLIHGDQAFVVFVGAGASAMPPSNLPTWNEFNSLLLESLSKRLAAYSRNRQPTDEMLALFRSRRDDTRFFAPDFQAQLIEEEVGQDYFRVWQSLETEVYGPVHGGLAELASRGKLAAVITTNFDRLIEKALHEKGQAFEVFHDEKSFVRLPAIVDANPSILLVIKIHGSIEDPDSLVDTLKQRIVGRSEPLMEAIQVLLGKAPWLFLGFSGADFSYDSHYLGILDAAEMARGFVFLHREGAMVQEGVELLAQAYGAEKASIVSGDLKSWLAETFALSGNSVSSNNAPDEKETKERVSAMIQQWVNDLGPMATVNILYAMLKSSGLEHQAYWLLRKTWKSYRIPEDTRGHSYARYNYNHGISLLNAGLIHNPISLDDSLSNLLEWREQANMNAIEYFARAYREGSLLVAGGQMANVLSYRGRIGEAIAIAESVTDQALKENDKLALCDIALASVTLYDIIRLFEPAAGQLNNCLNTVIDLGDEPRRALLSVHLARFLTYLGLFEEAHQLISDGERISQRLDLQDVFLAARIVRGRWLTDSGKSDKQAVETLSDVVQRIHYLDDIPLFTKLDIMQQESTPAEIKGRNPMLCRALLDLNRAARFAGNGEILNQTLDELDELTVEIFPGYLPHYYLSYAQCLLHHGSEKDQEFVLDLVGRARSVAEECQNFRMVEYVDEFEKEFIPNS